MSKLYVGIDVSSRNNVVYLMKPDGSKHSNFSVENSPKGSAELVKQIVKALTSYNLTEVTVGLESTGCYGDHLVYFLKGNAELAKFNRSIHVLNPKQVKKFKDTYNDLQKNDYIDSFVIADCLRFGRINKEVYMDDARFKALLILTRQRFFAVQSLTAEKQRFLNVIFKKYSSLVQNKVFSNTFGASALALYEEFDSADTLAYMDLHELTDFLIEKSKNRFSDSEAVAKAIQKAARSSYRLPKTVNDSVNQVLSSSISLIRALEQQIKVLDKAIAEQMQLIPNTLQSIPGIGPVYSAGIIAEIGDIHRFKNQSALGKYAGLAWTQNQSGDFESKNTKLIRSGNKFLKYYLCEATLSLVRCDTEYSRFYHLKYNEVNKGQHKRALALTARKFVRLVYALLIDNKLYTPSEL
ncbi:MULTISPECIES: IS110 family transposase [unclassified Ruminococcus]|uniref:IS110 family transposase n=1 Tax=unclassified Ruminococcus TaxID=2608920 RepID=UPI00210C61B5|nr:MULTISPECIES: IS110 family transposase [unclassified Ruminococcus]MCQ4022093.1 IS110 family transposase [Ruminococcus sp. zg-924]MCQ4114413.1 IS110 family transposase [Ruminococcus sp. zg-921]